MTISLLMHPLAVAFLTVLATLFGKKFERLRRFFVPFLAFLSFCFFLKFGFDLYSKGLYETQNFSIPFGLFSLNFKLDILGFVFACLVSLLWGIASFYSLTYMKENYPQKNDSYFQFFYSLSVFIALLFSFANDLLTMFVLYELLTLSTILLVGFKRNQESKEGLFRYLTVLLGCSLLLLLPATMFVISHTGITTFSTSQGFLQNIQVDPLTFKIILLMFVIGAGKAAMFPVHIWLPHAMCAPTPVSGLLHAVAVVKVGAFFIIRIVNNVFGLDFLKELLSDFNFLMYISGFTIFISSFFAVFQSNLKKRLAYSTIGQISYIVLSLSTFTKVGLFTAMFQIISHAVAKILLFFTVGGFYTAAHSNQIVDFTGMAKSNKIACLTFVFATLSLCGMPFTVGLLNKIMLFYNAIDAQSYFTIFVFFTSAVLSFLYLMPVCYAIFKNVKNPKQANFITLNSSFKIVFLILAILNFILFILGSFVVSSYLFYVNKW